ncbi:YlqD family protein [Aquisalibacillus elongatus]|uniref:YlqD protein n=1 Tax=Aquisalibacillus elongatus TaxID=485577 RepID=A0A3N5BEY2_9BACI|nr:YlqD family protein [Aquisalibacillus elongatus]RPF56017.1 YlqD protein [Aquisalibacillus elongatus]
MKIFRKTTVKQVITEESRESLKRQFQRKIGQSKKELEQLQFEKKKLIHQQRFNQTKIEERFTREEHKRNKRIEWLSNQLERLDQVPIGSEIIEGEVDELVDVEIGDDWDQVAGKRSITIKDGKIIDIN